MAQTHSLDLEQSSSQYASITDGSQTGLDVTGDITIEAWIQIESIGTESTIVAKYETTGNQRSYRLFITNSGNLRFQASSDGTFDTNTTLLDIESNNTLQKDIGKPIHIALTWDVSAGKTGVLMYRNGDTLSYGQYGSANPISIFDSTGPFIVGATSISGSPTSYFDGLIKDVRIFNDIRSINEIIADTRTQNVSDANLQGEWNFNDVYTDSSGNGNTLTTSGSPVFVTTRFWTAPNQAKNSAYLETNLSAWWALEDVNDSKGTNNLTNNNAAVFVAGKKNDAVDLEYSSSQYLSITDAVQTGLDITSDLGFSCWVKPESQPAVGEQRLIMSKFLSSGNQRSYSLRYKNNGGSYELILLINDDGSSSEDYTFTCTLSNATWYHITVGWDASLSTAEIFVNGVSVGVVTGTKTSIYNGTADFILGQSANLGASEYWDGLIDEASIYSRLLHYGDALDIYNTGNGITYDEGIIFAAKANWFI